MNQATRCSGEIRGWGLHETPTNFKGISEMTTKTKKKAKANGRSKRVGSRSGTPSGSKRLLVAPKKRMRNRPDGIPTIGQAEDRLPAPGGMEQTEDEGIGCGHRLHPVVLAGGKTCCEERSKDDGRTKPDDPPQDVPNGSADGSENEGGRDEDLPIGEGSHSVDGIGLDGVPEVQQRKSEAIGLLIPPIKADLIREHGRLQFLTEPIREETTVAVFHSWWTDCGRYCVARVRSKLEGLGTDWAAGMQENDCRKLISRDHRSVVKAIQSVVAKHRQRYEFEEDPLVNEKELEEKSREFFSACGEDVVTMGQSPNGREGSSFPECGFKENKMKVSTSKAVSFLKTLGMSGNPDKLEARINNINEYVSEDAELSKDEKKLLQSFRDAIAKNQKIEVVAEATAKPGKAPKAEKASNGKDKKTAGKKKTPKATKGSPKEGSMIGFVLSCLKSGPIPQEDIIKKTAKKFPDSKPESLAASVRWYMTSPKGLAKYGIKVIKTEKGCSV